MQRKRAGSKREGFASSTPLHNADTLEIKKGNSRRRVKMSEDDDCERENPARVPRSVHNVSSYDVEIV